MKCARQKAGLQAYALILVLVLMVSSLAGSLLFQKNVQAFADRSEVVLLNDFDETDVTYTNTEGWFSYAMTFSAKRDNNSELCADHASIEGGVGTDGTRAARFWQIRGSSENDKAVSYVRLYDKAADGYRLFTPKENTYYTFSIKVKVVTCSKHINLQLRSAAEDGTIAYNDTVLAVFTKEAIEVSENTDWQEFTVTFLNEDTTAPLYIALTTHDTWWSEVSEVYLDDIEIIKRREIPVSISNYDGEDQIVPVLPDITFSEFEPAPRSGYEFAGCYTDEAKTQKANDDDLVTESEHIWVKWKLKKASGTEPVLTKHLSGDLNDDKNVDMTDLIRLRKMSAGAVDITYGADLDGDGDYASSEDLDTMKQYILGAPGTKYGRKLVWADEFNYSELDRSIWKYKQTMTTNDTEYSEENNRANTRFEHGNMTLQVNRIDDNTYSVVQGLVSQGNLLFQYGYLEMRAKIPTCGGSWPGFWLMADTPYLDFSTYGYWPEIDIFEAFGNNKVKAELHKHFTDSSLSLDGYESTYGSISTGSYRYSISEGWHTFGFMWDDTTMKFYVDDQLYRTINYTRFTQDGTGAGAYQAPFYIMMNNEILNGLSWAGSWVTSSTETPIEYSIDYIRLYQDTTEGSMERLYTGEMAEKKAQ